MSHRKLERFYGYASLICVVVAVLLLAMVSSVHGETMGDDYAVGLFIVAVLLAALWRRRRRARVEAEILAEAYERQRLQQTLAEGRDTLADNIARLRATDRAPTYRR